jgi:hypothetical protein
MVYVVIIGSVSIVMLVVFSRHPTVKQSRQEARARARADRARHAAIVQRNTATGFHAVYAGQGYGGRAVHLMRGKRNVMSPGGEVAAQLVYFGSNPRTLCGMRVARDMSSIFAASDVSCRECARRAGIR